MLSVVEAGIGFGFLAVIISYLPVLYQAFSRRLKSRSRCLTPAPARRPSAGEFLRRWERSPKRRRGHGLLAEWERWAAELLESHVSYPVLSYYRSQHDNQSWVAALTMILDTSALLIAGEARTATARLTFAMAHHARCRFGDGVPETAASAGVRPLARCRIGQFAEDAAPAGIPVRDEASVAERVNGIARTLRAVRECPGGLLSVRAAPLSAEQTAGGQLANKPVDAPLPDLGAFPGTSSTVEHFH